MQITLQNVRLSFPQLFTAKSVNDGAPRYSANFLLDPTDPAQKAQIKTVKKAIKTLCEKELKGIDLPMDKTCLRNKGSWQGYEGMWYVSSANPKRPAVVDRDRTPLVADEGKPYAGCYVTAIIRLWAQNNNFGKRINASVEIVQFIKDGEAFGATPPPVSDLPPVSDEADDWDDDEEDDDDDL